MTQEELRKRFGAQLRMLRRRCSLSLEALEDRSGISASSLSAYERGEGNPSLQSLSCLARALSVPIYVLGAPPGADPSAPEAELRRGAPPLQLQLRRVRGPGVLPEPLHGPSEAVRGSSRRRAGRLRRPGELGPAPFGAYIHKLLMESPLKRVMEHDILNGSEIQAVSGF